MTSISHLLEPEIPRLKRYARKLTRDTSRADDLVQSCLTRALAKQHLWEPGTHLRAWLFTILHNQHVNETRRLMREGNVVTIEAVTPHLAALPSIEAAVDLGETEAAIARLPEMQREIIRLAGHEGMRYDEIAEVLGLPVGTVRSRLSRARARLRELMEIDEAAAARPTRWPHSASMRRAA